MSQLYSLNRLIREDNKDIGTTILFTYDNAGNITERCKYDYTTKSGEELEELKCEHYSYDYEGDRLVNYNGKTFEYNSLGNPIGEDIKWEYGTRLVKWYGTEFTYDGLGRRTSKTKDGKIITFTYDSDGRLIKQSNGLEFIYDNSGVVGVKHGGAQYLYRKDAQGNIIAILDSNGNAVVYYEYDAWGNNIALNANGAEITSGIGVLNPFRYRGYYYDTETELYYLQTRYYDPELGRFISQDSLEYADPETINGLNLYAYCGDNPVMNVDPTGKFFWSILISAIVFGTIFGAVSGGVSAAKNGESIWKGALIGGLKGLVTGAAFGLGGALGAAAFATGTVVTLGASLAWATGVAAVSFGAGLGINYLESKLYNTQFTWENACAYAGIFAIENVLNFGMGLLLGNKGYWPQNDLKFKGVFNKIIGAVKFMASNATAIIERTYLKNAFLLPVTIILDNIWKIKKLNIARQNKLF